MNEFEKFWHFPLIRMGSGLEVTVSQIVLTTLVVVVGLVFAWYLKRLLGRQLTKSKVDPNAALIIQRVFFYAILILLFITALGMLDIPVTALAFISGAVAIGIGFGAQNIINNLISNAIKFTLEGGTVSLRIFDPGKNRHHRHRRQRHWNWHSFQSGR